MLFQVVEERYIRDLSEFQPWGESATQTLQRIRRRNLIQPATELINEYFQEVLQRIPMESDINDLLANREWIFERLGVE